MEREQQSFQLILTDQDGLGRITVDLESFFLFSFSIATELEAQIEHWREAYPEMRILQTTGFRRSF